jgi:hypothetical protein
VATVHLFENSCSLYFHIRLDFILS